MVVLFLFTIIVNALEKVGTEFHGLEGWADRDFLAGLVVSLGQLVLGFSAGHSRGCMTPSISCNCDFL